MSENMSREMAVAALRAVQAKHETAYGILVGFLMTDVTKVFGSLSKASEMLIELMQDNIVTGVPAVIDGDVHTLYQIADAFPQTSRTLQ